MLSKCRRDGGGGGGSRYKLPGPDYVAYVFVFLCSTSILIPGFRRDVNKICALLGYTMPRNTPEEHRSLYHYLSTVQINPVRPSPIHPATESQCFPI
jgi:hypothetical protein